MKSSQLSAALWPERKKGVSNWRLDRPDGFEASDAAPKSGDATEIQKVPSGATRSTPKAIPRASRRRPEFANKRRPVQVAESSPARAAAEAR
jgi:hypothetical protein